MRCVLDSCQCLSLASKIPSGIPDPVLVLKSHLYLHSSPAVGFNAVNLKLSGSQDLTLLATKLIEIGVCASFEDILSFQEL